MSRLVGLSARSLLVLLLSACAGDRASTFESAGGGPYPPDLGSGEDAGGGGDRSVEEADLFRFADQRLYVLNQYRGLYVFDVSDPDRPVELGRVPLAGYPVEMYVRDGVAHAIVSDYFSYWIGPAAEGVLEPVYGSRIVSIDVSDPAAPEVVGDVLLDGWVTDTRLVGDVIYAAANRYGPWTDMPGVPDGETADETVITSIDVSAGAPALVERLVLSRTADFVIASPEAFVIAGRRWDDSWSGQTEVTWVDISSPAGEMRARGSVLLDGELREDTALDLWQGQLRILVRDWQTAITRLHILDGTHPDTLPALGTLDYAYDGSLFGTTFDADRLYMVHYQRIDPLEVVDLSDPTHPVVAGILEMPGWVERIAPLGDRLIGLGVDDTSGWRIAVSLFDVADPAAPALLDRITSGEDWSWSTALWERKAWLVDGEEGLILFPYSGWSDGATVYRHALGIIELGPDSLTPRGEVQAPAPVDRGALYQDRVYAISLAALQVVDVRDREHPLATATVELARNVVAYRRAPAAGLELVQSGLDYWYGAPTETDLRVTPLDRPDGPDELARLTLPRPAGALILDGITALAVRGGDWCYPAWDRGAYGWCEPTDRAGATVIDVADPSAPGILASLDFPAPDPLPPDLADRAFQWSWWLSSYGGPAGGAGEPALILGGGRYGWIRVTSIECYDLVTCMSLGIEPDYLAEDASWAYGWRSTNTLVVLDLAAEGGPAFTGEVALGEGTVDAALAQGDLVAASIFRPSRIDDDGRAWVRYYLERIQVGPGGSLTRHTPVNIPGAIAWLDPGGGRALTVDRQYVDRDGWLGAAVVVDLVAVDLGADAATETSRLRIGDEIGSLTADGDRVYAVRTQYAPITDGWIEWSPAEARLLAIDARDRDDLSIVSDQPLGAGYWWVASRTASTLVLAGGVSGGLALFDVAADPDRPAYLDFVRTLGWATTVVQDGATLYVVGGPYGIQTIPIAAVRGP